MTNEPKEGANFRQNYLRGAELQPDSMRMRRRLHAIVEPWYYENRYALAQHMRAELGVDYQTGSDQNFWLKANIDDVVTAVTALVQFDGAEESKADMIAKIKRIFEDENLRYRIDSKGGVHFKVDQHFEASVAAALIGLGHAKYKAARTALEEALDGLGAAAPSGKAFIRGIFETVESAYLVTIQNEKVDRIGPDSLDRDLSPLLIAKWKAYPEVDDRVKRLLDVLKPWIKAAHPFRHGAAVDQVHEAPIDYAIALGSQGITFLRLITGLRQN